MHVTLHGTSNMCYNNTWHLNRIKHAHSEYLPQHFDSIMPPLIQKQLGHFPFPRQMWALDMQSMCLHSFHRTCCSNTSTESSSLARCCDCCDGTSGHMPLVPPHPATAYHARHTLRLFLLCMLPCTLQLVLPAASTIILLLLTPLHCCCAYFFFLSLCCGYLRVGANSPNLWPTMFSATSMRVIRLLPLCTKKTHLRKSGSMTLALLCVRMMAGAGAPWKRVLLHQSGCARAIAITSFSSDTAT